MENIAMITGVTSGFGRAIVLRLASKGWNVIGTGRRVDRLDLLKKEIEEKYGDRFLPLPLDVRMRKDVFDKIADLPNEWKNIKVLVNNAGLAAGLEYFDEAALDDWDEMIDTNVKGLLYVTKAVLPLMKGKKGRHIVNIGSTAGKEVYEKGNVYCATKHAVDALTKAMRIDLLRHGIKVSGICPGAAETEFSLVRFKGDKERAKKVYEGYQPLTAEDIADIVDWVIHLPENVCVNDLVVTALNQANSFYIKRDI